VNFGPLAAEIVSLVWGTPGNFNGFRVLAALLHGTVVVGVSQTLRRWTEGATYFRQGGHHVGHWPTFLVLTDIIGYDRLKLYLKIYTPKMKFWVQHCLLIVAFSIARCVMHVIRQSGWCLSRHAPQYSTQCRTLAFVLKIYCNYRYVQITAD